MQVIKPVISFITLNVNMLNFLLEWVKTKSTHMLFTHKKLK